mmetsp:Transcript_72860/g.152133  ORF Transcript_72860/g.152133 Transcript_72860/m.152133 type:complete len:97 (-) Transcript_72860:53-343(-)
MFMLIQEVAPDPDGHAHCTEQRHKDEEGVQARNSDLCERHPSLSWNLEMAQCGEQCWLAVLKEVGAHRLSDQERLLLSTRKRGPLATHPIRALFPS